MTHQLRLFRDTAMCDEVLFEGPYGVLRAKVADAMNSLGEKFDKTNNKVGVL